MKKTAVFALFALLLGFAGNIKAQYAPDCDALILPRYNNDTTVLDILAPEKAEWLCTYAHNALYLTNSAPRTANIHDISEVRCFQTNEFLPANYVVDITTFSVYGFNFSDFQYQHRDEDVYFRVGNQNNQYMVLRNVRETNRLTDEALRSGNGYAPGFSNR